MIKREFWENIAQAWSKKGEIYIPEIKDDPDESDDIFENVDVGELDDLLRELLAPALGGEFDRADSLSDDL